MKKIIATYSFLFLLGCTSFAEGKYKAIPLLKDVLVTSSEPRKTLWTGLTEKEQKLAGHLLRAANASSALVLDQSHRHALLIKSVLDKSLNQNNIATTKKELGENFQEYLNYVAKFEDQYGPYAPSNRKIILKKVSPAQVEKIFQKFSKKPNAKIISECVKLLTDPDYEVISKPEDAAGTDLEISGGNMYEKGLKGSEVAQALKNGLKSDLNCRIEKDASGKIICNLQALSNPNLNPRIRNILTYIVDELSLALPLACTEHQAAEIKYLISYLQKGTVEDFRQMNIEWVKDGTHSTVDFMMGYVETYEDYLNQIGSWEAYVQIVDPKTTKLSVNLAKNAQAFEDKMPYGKWKKTFPKDYSPPALMVYYFKENASFRSGGYNLPNFDDIRRDVGAKNIIRLDLPGQDKDPTSLKVRREMFEEFTPPSKVENVLGDWAKARQAIVLLHEIIGHGSGTYDETKYLPKEDPVGALGALGSALEEQRADLAALVFAADPILVKMGYYSSNEEALRVRNSMYDTYNVNFLFGVSKQRSLSEAHQRGHWLLIHQLLEKGAIEKVSKDGSPLSNDNLVLAIKDYELYHQVCLDLLAELQRIKAVKDMDALKNLFSKEASLDEIQQPWMQAIIKRGEKLAANAGSFQQPWYLDEEKNEIKTLGDSTLEGIAPFIGL